MISRGSEWRRWEPHIHAPGTLLNNQFKEPDAWGKYLTSLETATPTIEAVGVTDYYITDLYEEVLRYHEKENRLSGVGLIFPNIELRLDVGTKSGFVNIHLLINPKDKDHLAKIHRFLSRLHFSAFEDQFDCTRPELIRLGYKSEPNTKDDRTALRHGVEQFKVNFKELRNVWRENAWAKENILIAVAGGSSDGTSGVRQPADKIIRQEIEKFAHIIFSGSEKQRKFWLGLHGPNEAQIREYYGCLKPCLHGSDAHRNEDVAAPFGDRFSWIKGDLEFSTLRQACIEPTGRVYIGSEAPKTATPSQVIDSVSIHNASWVKSPIIPLNPRLVAIIGARGSGKTALVDMIAAGCNAINPSQRTKEDGINSSFLVRAHSILKDEIVEIVWGTGETVSRYLDNRDADNIKHYPRVRYLSQQFVEKLCSVDGIADELTREIERVIFDAHPPEIREGAINFEQLRDDRIQIHRQAREREVAAIAQISEQIGAEHEKDKLKSTYEMQITQKTNLINNYTMDRARLIVKGSDEQVTRYNAISKAVENKRTQNRALVMQKQAFVLLQSEVASFRSTGALENLRQIQARHMSTNMNDQQWQAFLLDYKGPVDSDLDNYIRWADQEIKKLRGTSPIPGDEAESYISNEVNLAEVPLAVLEAEMRRVEKLIKADQSTQRHYAELTRRITAETSALEDLRRKFEDAKEANTRICDLDIERDAAYRKVFEALIAEQSALKELYRPLMEELATVSGSLGKLAFSVARTANVEEWASETEKGLLDLRRQGPFRGQGSLVEKARAELGEAWEQGSAEDIGKAMSKFREKHQKKLLEHCPVSKDNQNEMRTWLRQFARWFFSVDHLSVQYGISYDGVDIRKLSPGTRGIVLLLLYLALDKADDSPLIIDQPEENLDPQSVFDELVGRFTTAKNRRQIIIVTHNANLVINTDADQVIIAKAGQHSLGDLPPITYVAGGLENADIRKALCDILEGGEHAFRERARRLRVHLDR